MIKTIKLKNFRKFKELQLETSNQIIIFSGPNASGKTSVLESIYLTAKILSLSAITFFKNWAKCWLFFCWEISAEVSVSVLAITSP